MLKSSLVGLAALHERNIIHTGRHRISALLLAATATADFHIIQVILGGTYHSIPSNKYDCENALEFGTVTSGAVGSDSFKVTGNT